MARGNVKVLPSTGTLSTVMSPPMARAKRRLTLGLIGRRAPVSEIFAAAREEGMSSLYEDGLEKVYQGCTTVGEVRRVCVQAHDELDS